MTPSAPLYLRAAEDLSENEDQWKAYNSLGNCVILAGPGSGKTKTVTIKIARLLQEDVRQPRRIACITYSNACVAELRARLKKLGVDDDRRLCLSTVHSFCLTELVSPYAALAKSSVPQPFNIASDTQSKRLFDDAYKATVGGDCKSWFRTECEKLRRLIPNKSSAEWRAASSRETRVIEAYEQLLQNEGLVDFDGMVLAGLELVENHAWVRQAIRAKYPIIVIDEYQDLGLPLHRMVLSLMQKAGVRIIAVGDPDQSIYGFTGARPQLLKDLSGLKGVELVRLKLNYRCADRIIEASKVLLPDPAAFRSHDGRKGEIQFYRVLGDVRQQAHYALSTIIPQLLSANQKWRSGDIAILYRSLHEGNSVAQAADALHIRYFRSDNGAPIKRMRVTDWLIDTARWCSGGWKSGSVTLSQVMKAWKRLRRSLSQDKLLLAARRSLISALFSERDGATPLHQWLLRMKEAVLQPIFDEESDFKDERKNFESLLALSANDGLLKDYTVEIFGNQGKSPDQINFMTLHSCKGLEFEAVIMVGLENGVMPHEMDKTAEKIQESARLFYVGVTRAKSQVHLMFNSHESPFITEIRKVA